MINNKTLEEPQDMLSRWWIFQSQCSHDKTGSLDPEGCFYQAYLECDYSCPSFREYCKQKGFFHIDLIPHPPFKIERKKR